MYRIWILFSLLLAPAFSERIEIYEDWKPWAVGPVEKSSLASSLEKRGLSVRYWDREAHAQDLLTWKGVKTWDDFKHWLKPRKNVLDRETSYLIFSNLGVHLRDLNLGRIPREKLILFQWEPPTVQPEIWDPKVKALFHKIYTWNDDFVDGAQFFKFHLPYLTPKMQETVPYEERKFLTLIASRLSSKHPNELYSEREKLIRFFEKRADVEFDLYGKNWEKRKFRCWKGRIPDPDKMVVLKHYRFSFCYENSIEPGYITEKLWDCFAAGVVPVYWGAPNVEDYIPSNTFVDRRSFKTDDDLLSFLESMTKEEWDTYVESAESFLTSEEAAKFTVESYIQLFTEAAATKSPQLLF